MFKSTSTSLIAALALSFGSTASAASAKPVYTVRVPIMGMHSVSPATAVDGSADPYFASVTSLVHFEGTNGGSSFADVKGNAISVFGQYATSTTTKHAGTAAGFGAATGGVSVGGTQPMGAGDFTIEGWVYPTNGSGSQILFDARPPGGNGFYPCITFENGYINYYVNYTYVISGPAVPLNSWNHFAVSRVSGTTRLFLNGQPVGSPWQNSTYLSGGDYSISGNRYFGNGQGFVSGYMDDIRVTVGVGRYSSNFAVPQSFPDK